MTEILELGVAHQTKDPDKIVLPINAQVVFGVNTKTREVFLYAKRGGDDYPVELVATLIDTAGLEIFGPAIAAQVKAALDAGRNPQTFLVDAAKLRDDADAYRVQLGDGLRRQALERRGTP